SPVGVTFNTLQALLSPQDEALGTFGFAGGTSGTATYNLSLAPGLVTDVLSGNNLSLRLNAADSVVSYLFASRSNVRSTSGRPLLTIVAVPEPSSLGLLVIGFAAVFGRKFVRCDAASSERPQRK
ncbi:MAG: hypothetical protein DME65_12345, partial [Verrucomicrobia bacterium]